MPSSIIRHSLSSMPTMQYSFQPSYRPNPIMISPLSWCAIGDELTGMGAANFASATYPAASRVLAYPFEIADNFLVQKVWWMNGTTASTDSADCGVYNEAGTVLLVSGGSTAITGANVIQEKDCTDTLIVPGRYWLAYIQSGVTATTVGASPAIALVRAMGMAQQAGAGSTLGSTFTPAAIASAYVPLCGIAGRTQVA